MPIRVPSVEKMIELLGRSEESARQVLEHQIPEIDRIEHLGFLEFKVEGFSVGFNEAPWGVSRNEEPSQLYVNAFHLYRGGYQGYQEFSGLLPKGLRFGDGRAAVVAAYGNTNIAGENELMVSFSCGRHREHFQFDPKGSLELVTLFIPDRDVK